MLYGRLRSRVYPDSPWWRVELEADRVSSVIVLRPGGALGARGGLPASKSGDPSSLGDVRNLKLGIGEKCQCEGRK